MDRQRANTDVPRQREGGLIARRLWGPQDVAEYLGVPVQTLYQWRTRHYGPPGTRIGRHVRYRPADVEAWVTDQIESQGRVA